MKRVFLLVLCLLSCANLHAAASLLQHTNKNQTSNVSSDALAFGSNNTAGSLLVMVLRLGDATNTVSVTDSRSQTWTNAVLKSNVAGGRQLGIWYFANCSAGANTVTVTVTLGSASSMRYAIYEYSGMATSLPLDQTNSSTGNSTTINSGNITTTQAAEVLMGGAEKAVDTFTATGSFTIEDEVPAAPNTLAVGMDRIVASTGTYSSGATILAGADWTGVVASFKVSSGFKPMSTTLTGVGVILLYWINLARLNIWKSNLQ